MVRKIVVAVDRSPAAKKMLDWTAAKILNKDDHIIALYCTPERSMFGFGGLVLDEHWGRIQSEEVKIAETTLRDMRVEAEKIGIAINTESRPGSAHEVIIEYCHNVRPDLLIMGRESSQPFWGGGSVSAHCIAHAPCPVLVVREETIAHFKAAT